MTTLRVLITGAQGYVGQHLCRKLLLRHELELHGTYRSSRTGHHSDRLTLHQLDLCDPVAVNRLIDTLQPHQIYHLAGNIRAGRTSSADSKEAWNDNLLATLTLYEACKPLAFKPKIIFASTGAVYGQCDGKILETSPMKPLSSYAASKAAADLASYQYWAQHGLPIIRARIFNFLGPGQDESTAMSHFAHQLTKLERDRPDPAILRVGNLNAERDFLDIADLTRAIVQLMEIGEAGEAYNVASGISHPMRWYLAKLLLHIRIPVQVVINENQYRNSEAQRLKVKINKLQDLTRWEPMVPLEQTLATMVEACRSALPD